MHVACGRGVLKETLNIGGHQVEDSDKAIDFDHLLLGRVGVESREYVVRNACQVDILGRSSIGLPLTRKHDSPIGRSSQNHIISAYRSCMAALSS